MNKAFLIGRLTKEPELRTTSGKGTSVCTFTVAVDRKFKGEDGKKESDFIPVVTWKGLAENCSRYLRKGSLVGVIGSVQTRSYDGKDGQKRYATEIVADEVEFLESKKESSEQQSYADDITPVEDDMPF